MRRTLHVFNRTRNTTIVQEGEIADNLWTRFIGLMGRRELQEGFGLLLCNESAIHTFGMRLPIDIVYLDAQGTVVRVTEAMPPARLGPLVRGVRDVLELPIGTLARTMTTCRRSIGIGSNMITQPRRLQDEVNLLGGRLLDLLFPPRCVNCRRSTGALCATCLRSIQPIPPPLCERCGRELISAGAACRDCRNHPLTITRLSAAAWHEGAARQAVHALKYLRRKDMALPLAGLLAQELARANLSFDLITGVPLHPTRQAERGYNQAELLGRETASLVGAPYLVTLERTCATADQIGLNAQARRMNVLDAFRVIRASPAGLSIVLVDDVYTTGATLDACATALFQGGARAVYGLTVSRPQTLA